MMHRLDYIIDLLVILAKATTCWVPANPAAIGNGDAIVAKIAVLIVLTQF